MNSGAPVLPVYNGGRLKGAVRDEDLFLAFVDALAKAG